MASVQSDSHYMLRAIGLAMRGRGRVEPNPMVGCVIVKDGHTIGEGYHERFGGPHAEPEAVAACTTSPRGATVYVTLEPCCHVGKKTPPCVPLLVGAGIAQVVIGCVDPNPEVSGHGAAQLRDAGVAVEIGVLETRVRQLIAPFVARMAHHRPYVTLKWAQTVDGKVAGAGGRRMAITNPTSHRVVHALRADSDAILVGINTAIADDPLLTTRGFAHARPLLRIVLDSRLRLPLHSQLVRTARHTPLLVYTCAPATSDNSIALIHAGVQVIAVPPDAQGHPSIEAVLADLYGRQVTHLMVEGGPTVASAFLSANLADRIWVFRSKTQANSPTAPSSPTVDLPVTGELDLHGDRLTELLNPASDAFFHLTASPDLVRAADLVNAPANAQ